MTRVYVSSTLSDLVSERQAVFDWLVARGLQPVHSYRPDSESVRESCLDDVDSCDLYVVILGYRYGNVINEPNTERLSITQLEFRRASKIPRVALLRTNLPDDVRFSDLEDKERSPLILAFRQEVKDTVRCFEFKDSGALMMGLSTGIEAEMGKLRLPEHKRADEWLAIHLKDVASLLEKHIAAATLNVGPKQAPRYLDLVVAEKRMGDREGSTSDSGNGKQRCTLEEVLQQELGPLLLFGEGGCGKTTSLLYAAARAADRAATDETASIPVVVNLARLTELNDLEDLHQLIVDSVPVVNNWNEFSDLGILKRRRFLFLFDSFNEMPERLQSSATVILTRFVEKQKEHACLIGSRPVAQIEQLARQSGRFRVFQILRLTPEQARDLLRELGLGSLYDRMPDALRDLAGNPFMLLAIARVLADEPGMKPPQNRGRLYQRFADGWMKNEEGKRSRSLQYHFERVKKPLLAYLAKRMTAAGLTSLVWTEEVVTEVEKELGDIYQRIKRRGGMPEDWTVDSCLDEMLGDGLVKRIGDQLQFMHQSLQEYFTGVCFLIRYPEFPQALVEFTPRLAWELVPTYSIADVPTHRFAPALLMMTGLLDDSTKFVDALIARNPILAAAALASSSKVDPSLVARMEQNWLELLENTDLRHRVVGCSCVVHAASKSPHVIRCLIEFALGQDFNSNYVGVPALGKLNASEAIARELIERVHRLPEELFDRQENDIGKVVQALGSTVVRMLLDEWRVSPLGAPIRQRLEGLMASVGRPALQEELRKIRLNAADPAVAFAAESALAESESWEGATGIAFSASRLDRIFALAKKRSAEKRAELESSMRRLGDEQIVVGLQSPDPIARQVAASLAAERRMPVGDAIVEQILRHGESDLIEPLRKLTGDEWAVTRLIERTHEQSIFVGDLPVELSTHLSNRSIEGAMSGELKRLGLPTSLMVEGKEIQDGISTWILRPSSWSGARDKFKFRVSAEAIEVYDCSVAGRVIEALASVPGEAARVALWRTLENDEPENRITAIDALAGRDDPALGDWLLAHLKSERSPHFVNRALSAIAHLRPPGAVSLVNELLALTEEDGSDVHPIWGSSGIRSGWGDSLSRVLRTIDADNEIQGILDDALASDNPARRAAALDEFSRWFEKGDLGDDRWAAWTTTERMQRIQDLALRDPVQRVRLAAIQALAKHKTDPVVLSLAAALANDSTALRVSAAEALIGLEIQEYLERIAKMLLQVARFDKERELQIRAAALLSEVPDGIEPLYRPIQDELTRDQWERALELINETLEILPEDVNLFWWRGHAQSRLNQLKPAADSFQRAFELEERVAAIPQVLAQTFLQLEDFSRALATARRGVEIEPGNADVQAILAWSSYKAGEIPSAVEAARKALGLDPVHADAIWIQVLAHLRQDDAEASSHALDHALSVRQLLSPGLDESFLNTFIPEVESITTDNPNISKQLAKIKDALPS